MALDRQFTPPLCFPPSRRENFWSELLNSCCKMSYPGKMTEAIFEPVLKFRCFKTTIRIPACAEIKRGNFNSISPDLTTAYPITVCFPILFQKKIFF